MSRKMNSVYLRCLLYMYRNQKLCVKWNGQTSEFFIPKNGVKQGGILSPLLFCTYMDHLLTELRLSGEGCYLGPYFCGALGYADDVCLLSPSLDGLQKMIAVCENYSNDYKVTFNGAKSQLLKFGSNQNVSVDNEFVVICGKKVHCMASAMHLGHKLVQNPYKDDQDSVINSFYRQFNLFRSRFGFIPSHVRSMLFTTYCTSFYGIQLCELKKLNKLHVTLRKCIRNIWGLPYMTHSRLVHCINNCLCPMHMCIKRFLKFALVHFIMILPL
jgi:hypothetical protein